MSLKHEVNFNTALARVTISPDELGDLILQKEKEGFVFITVVPTQIIDTAVVQVLALFRINN